MFPRQSILSLNMQLFIVSTACGSPGCKLIPCCGKHTLYGSAPRFCGGEIFSARASERKDGTLFGNKQSEGEARALVMHAHGCPGDGRCRVPGAHRSTGVAIRRPGNNGKS